MADLYQNDKDELRAALVLEGLLWPEHRSSIEQIGRVYAHTIVYRAFIEESTCVPYALGLSKEPAYRAVAGNFNREIFAGRRFVEWLLQDRLCETNQFTLDCLALYFTEERWTHAGVTYEPGRIVSQWGTYAVYEHGVFEVPAFYGHLVRYFHKPTPADALRIFLEYAKSCGLSDDQIGSVIR